MRSPVCRHGVGRRGTRVAAAACVERQGRVAAWSTPHWKPRAWRRRSARRRSGLRRAMQRKSTIAFLMTLPLILLIALLVHLSGVLFAASRDPEQVDGALRRLRQLPLPVQARDVLDGGEAVLHLRHHRGHLQSADRLHRRAFRAQHPEQGTAQVARHAAGAVGHPAGDELPRLAVAVRSLLQRLQLGAGAVRHRPGRRGPATPTGRASRSSWSMCGSARRSS